MIARLIATGSLLDKGALFWDEPEANLNPKLVKLVARAILNISQSGIQVFIATHSLFCCASYTSFSNKSFRRSTHVALVCISIMKDPSILFKARR